MVGKNVDIRDFTSWLYERCKRVCGAAMRQVFDKQPGYLGAAPDLKQSPRKRRSAPDAFTYSSCSLHIVGDYVASPSVCEQPFATHMEAGAHGVDVVLVDVLR